MVSAKSVNRASRDTNINDVWMKVKRLAAALGIFWCLKSGQEIKSANPEILRSVVQWIESFAAMPVRPVRKKDIVRVESSHCCASQSAVKAALAPSSVSLFAHGCV